MSISWTIEFVKQLLALIGYACRVATTQPTTDTKRRILDHLKRVESARVADLAANLAITTTAVRQHLDALEANGLVERVEARAEGGRGRPAARWRLTELAADLFPDRHSDLTVELIEAIRSAVGDDGLDAVIAERTAAQRRAYEAALAGEGALGDRVAGLAAQRSAEGYLAEVAEHDDGSFELVEHHCPICDAATACSGLCRDELELFRSVIGEAATVERTTHLLSGDSRCSYRVTPVSLS